MNIDLRTYIESRAEAAEAWADKISRDHAGPITNHLEMINRHRRIAAVLRQALDDFDAGRPLIQEIPP